MSYSFTATQITAIEPKAITKRFTLDNGRLIKSAAATVVAGMRTQANTVGGAAMNAAMTQALNEHKRQTLVFRTHMLIIQDRNDRCAAEFASTTAEIREQFRKGAAQLAGREVAQ